MYKVNIKRATRFAITIEQDPSLVERNLRGINEAIEFSLCVLFPTNSVRTVRLSNTGKTIYLECEDASIDINEYIKLVVSCYLKELDLFFKITNKSHFISMLSKYIYVIEEPIMVLLKNIEDRIGDVPDINKEVAITAQVDHKNDLLEHCDSIRTYMKMSESISNIVYRSLKEDRMVFSELLRIGLREQNIFVKNANIDIINSEIHCIYGDDLFNLSKVKIDGMLEKIINMSTSKELVFYAIKANIPLMVNYIKKYRKSSIFGSKEESAFVRFNGISMENEYVRISNKQLRSYASKNSTELSKGLQFLNMVLIYLDSKRYVYENSLIQSDFQSKFEYISNLAKFIGNLINKKDLNCSIEVSKNNDSLSVLYKVSKTLIYKVNLASNEDSTIIHTKSIQVNIINEIKRVLSEKRDLEVIISLIENNLLNIKSKYEKSVLKSIPPAKLHFLNDSEIVYKSDKGDIDFKQCKGLISITTDDNKYLFKFNDDESIFTVDISSSKKEVEQEFRNIIGKLYGFFEQQVGLLKEEYKEKNANFRNALKDLFPNNALDIIIEFLYLCNEEDYILTKELIEGVLIEGKHNEDCAYSGVLKGLEEKEIYNYIDKLENIGLININDFGAVKFDIDVYEYIFKTHSKSLLNIKNIKENEESHIRDMMKLPAVDISRYLMHKNNLLSQERILLTTILDDPKKANVIQYELKKNLKGYKEVEKIKQLKLKLAKGNDDKISYLKKFL